MSALFGLGQALLQALDPERAHDLAIKSLELGIYPRAAAPDDPRLEQTLWGLSFRNPVGMAAGFDKDARVFAPLLATGFGFVEVGTLTPKPQKGNPSPRIFRSAVDGAIINRLGFNNEGQEAALSRLKGRHGGVVGVNIGAGRDSKDRIGDYVSGIAGMSPVADYLTINISSPNTPGLRDLQAPEALAALLERTQEARGAAKKRPPLLVKLAPDGSWAEDRQNPLYYLVHVARVALPLYPQFGTQPNGYYIPPRWVPRPYLRQMFGPGVDQALERYENPDRELLAVLQLFRRSNLIIYAYEVIEGPKIYESTLRGKRVTLYNDTVIAYGRDGREIFRTTVEEPVHVRDRRHANSI